MKNMFDYFNRADILPSDDTILTYSQSRPAFVLAVQKLFDNIRTQGHD